LKSCARERRPITYFGGEGTLSQLMRIMLDVSINIHKTVSEAL
jgi:hypothetical protein